MQALNKNTQILFNYKPNLGQKNCEKFSKFKGDG